MDENSFLQLCITENYSPNYLTLFKKALEIAKKSLDQKKRLSGDTYFDHNVRVADILASNHSAPEVVIAGILHGLPLQVLEAEVKPHFEAEIVELVKGAEELKHIKEKNPQIQADALRRILLSTLKDVRVIVIKLANKLDNLRTIQILPPEEQKRIAQETLSVYAPLAYRLGMDKIKTELEDLSLEILEPKKYQEISMFLQESKEQREEDINYALDFIHKITKDRVDIIKIKGRPKSIYSIYKKTTERKVLLDQLHDLLGLRIIVPEVKDCYTLLGLLHEKSEPIEGRLKDYITNPKHNFYRSIHTGLKLPNGKIIEIQIRTPEMDEFAEEGIAAHWRYKGISSEEAFEKKTAWLRGILDLQSGLEHKEFIESAKVDVFGDEIYCYTPKGDVKQLPKGASVLDFAYAVHEDIGSHAVGGSVNGKFAPLKYILSTGDVVDIVTNKNQRPRMSWVKFVISTKAKQKIRKILKETEKGPVLHYRAPKPILSEEQGILVESEEYPRAVCVLAKCCIALPGEDIVGIVTKRRIISVHKKECRHALKEEPRWVQVQWKEKFNQKIKFFVSAEERSGILADLLHTIANTGFEVKEAKAKLVDKDHALCSFSVIPKDLDHLKELVKRINKVKGLQSVYFE